MMAGLVILTLRGFKDYYILIAIWGPEESVVERLLVPVGIFVSVMEMQIR